MTEGGGRDQIESRFGTLNHGDSCDGDSCQSDIVINVPATAPQAMCGQQADVVQVALLFAVIVASLLVLLCGRPWRLRLKRQTQTERVRHCERNRGP